MSDLLKLADRVEALTGPDREVDEEIQAALVGASIEWSDARKCNVYHKDGHWVSIGLIHAYTASLDAAMALVPSMMTWNAGNDFGGAWAHVWLDDQHYDGTPFGCNGQTVALALCAAALKARGL